MSFVIRHICFKQYTFTTYFPSAITKQYACARYVIFSKQDLHSDSGIFLQRMRSSYILEPRPRARGVKLILAQDISHALVHQRCPRSNAVVAYGPGGLWTLGMTVKGCHKSIMKMLIEQLMTSPLF